MSNPPLESFGKFSAQAKTVLLAAQRYAEGMHQPLGSEHLLMAVTVTPDTAAYQLLRKIPMTPDQLRLALSVHQSAQHTTLGMQPEAKSVLERAAFQASVLGLPSIETECILWSLVSDANCTAHHLVTQLGIEPKSIRKSLERLFLEEQQAFGATGDIEILGVIGTDHHHHHPTHQAPKLPTAPAPTKPTEKSAAPNESELEPTETPMLDEFTVDLTALATQGTFDPVIGRAQELERIVHILGRKTKNNPVLLGEPGVGKTAIVEGLAQQIVAKTVPAYLQGVRIVSLELGTLIAGTMYRGQFEERLRRLVAELTTQPDTILFVDEVHTIVGAGSAEGSLDAANILKPMLAKGALRVIGATTTGEYQKYVEKDAALERRLQPVFVAEPSLEATVEILRGIAPRYCSYHGVRFEPELLEDIVRLADRYIAERHFPDKAIDVLDEAAAARKAKQAPKGVPRPSRFQLERQLKELRSQKEYEINQGNFERASYLRTKEGELKLEHKRLATERSQEATKLVTLTIDDVRAVISRATGIPATRLTASDRKGLLGLEERLGQRIIGQTEAVTRLAATIRRASAGMDRGSRPIGTYLLVGPTGVGKTETARVIAEEVFGDASALLKVDMSEYMERHQVARLLGAPPGYVGHDQASPILERIRRRPHQVLLLDEIEKAHPDVFNVLLQLLEDGVLTDGKGRSVRFRDTLILMTSNIGDQLWQQGRGLGFHGQAQTQEPWWKHPLADQLKNHFRPEFLNRLDGVLTYYPLTMESLARILDLELDRLVLQFNQRHVRLQLTTQTKQSLLNRFKQSSEGARAIRRLVQTDIENALADAVLRWPNAPAFILTTNQTGQLQIKRPAPSTKARILHGSKQPVTAT